MDVVAKIKRYIIFADNLTAWQKKIRDSWCEIFLIYKPDTKYLPKCTGQRL